MPFFAKPRLKKLSLGRSTRPLSVAVAVCFSGVALGQEASSDNNPPEVDEVIVTAQHRSQAIKDVPVSMSVIGGEDIRDAGIITFDDVARRAPNVSITSERESIYIRGFGSAGNALVESSVGFNIDGVTYGRKGYIREGFLDIERIEVLRGPQGTLYGKNAVAGAISIITVNPQDELGAQMKVAMGDFDQYQVDAAVTGPLFSDDLSGRIALASHRMGDYIENTTLDEGNGENTTNGIRGKLHWQITPGISVLGSLQFTDQATDGPQGELTKMSPEAQALYPAYDPETDEQLNYRVQRNEDSHRTRESWTGYFKADAELGAATVTSLTGFTVSEDSYLIDGDFSGAPVTSLGLSETYEQYSQELRFISGPGQFEYLLGAYFFYSSLDGDNDVRGLDDASGGGQTVDILVPDALAAALNIDGALPPLTPEQSVGDYLQENQSYALYGQASYQWFERLKIEAGLRMNYEVKDIHFVRTVTTPSIVLTAGGVEEFDFVSDRTEFDVTPRLSAIYDLTDDQTIYLTLARGVKSGGYSAAAINTREITFEPEQSDTIEFGTKGSFFASLLRLNLGLFYMKFDDLQVTSYNGTAFVISNAASATAFGAELDFMATPARWISFIGALGYNDATYDEYKTASCPATSPSQNVTRISNDNDEFCDLSGRRLSKAPEWTASLGARLTLPIDAIRADLVFTPNYTWQSDVFLNVDLDPLDAQEAFGLLGLNLSLMGQEGGWTASLNVTNALDEIYKTDSVDVAILSGSHAAFSGQPRRVLFSFGAAF